MFTIFATVSFLRFIGYKGPRTDYSKFGFPIENWNPDLAKES